MTASFLYDQPAQRVIFGVGALERLASEARRCGFTRLLLVSTPQRRFADQAVALLGDLVAGTFFEAAMHVPAETARAGVTQAQAVHADGCVAIGGGSTVGLAKIIALETGMPVVAVPTTYAGSEMTPIYGITDGGLKKTGRDRRVTPRIVVYDPTLTLSLPPRTSAVSGMNAIAHCVEALYAEEANPLITLIAAEGIRVLARSLSCVVRNPADLAARSDALYASWLGGIALGGVGMAIHHKLCHTLGGSFNLPHGDVHSVILPYAAAFNREAAAGAMTTAAAALDASDAAEGLHDLERRIGAPTSLADIGMRYEDLDRAAAIATANPYYNPRPVDYAGVRALLEDAYRGVRPSGRVG
jgi:maleylacetate reductase